MTDKMLINLSNHPKEKWTDGQKEAAEMQYGKVVDMAFPDVPPMATHCDIEKLASKCAGEIGKIGKADIAAVHVMGEMTLTYAIVQQLKERGYTCLASTTVREVYEQEPGKKVVTFQFVQFREY